MLQKEVVDGGGIAVGEGEWPFCSWTRLAEVALLIWGDRAKSGTCPAGDVIWRKIHPGMRPRMTGVTRWPKRHNTPKNGNCGRETIPFPANPFQTVAPWPKSPIAAYGQVCNWESACLGVSSRAAQATPQSTSSPPSACWPNEVRQSR